MEGEKSHIKFNLKDSVFTNLFSIPEYTRDLYLSLRGEDAAVTEDDVRVVTIENIMVYGMHNDLGFTVKGKELFMIEAQSTACPNITYRLNSYFCETIYSVYPEFELEQYGSRRAEGIPDLYFGVVYTGKMPVPDYYEDELRGFSGQTLKIRVQLLTKHNTTGILRAYCIFCEKYDEYRSLYGRTAKAVKATIEYCLECEETKELREYLSEHKREVENIMSSVGRQERLIEAMMNQEAKKGKAEGIAEGIAEGRTEERIGMLERYRIFLDSTGFSDELKKSMYDGFVTTLG